MKQEPANSVLEAGFLSQLGQKVSLDGPLDAEGLEVEMELNNLLLSLRPIKQVVLQSIYWSKYLSFFCSILKPQSGFPLLDRGSSVSFFWPLMEMWTANGRWYVQEQLIKDNSKLVLLAALSDTLDFLSDSVQE